jgi:hypothetical protein
MYFSKKSDVGHLFPFWPTKHWQQILFYERIAASKRIFYLFLVTDDIEEAAELIRGKRIKQFGLKPKIKRKPIKWLFEHA